MSTNGSNGEQTLLYETDSRKIRINAFGGQGGQYGFGQGYMDYDKNNDLKNTYLFGIGGNGGLSIKTDGTIGGSQSDEMVQMVPMEEVEVLVIMIKRTYFQFKREGTDLLIKVLIIIPL